MSPSQHILPFAFLNRFPQLIPQHHHLQPHSPTLPRPPFIDWKDQLLWIQGVLEHFVDSPVITLDDLGDFLDFGLVGRDLPEAEGGEGSRAEERGWG